MSEATTLPTEPQPLPRDIIFTRDYFGTKALRNLYLRSNWFLYMINTTNYYEHAAAKKKYKEKLTRKEVINKRFLSLNAFQSRVRAN